MDDDPDDWEEVRAALRRFGLPAKPADRPDIIAALEEQIRREADEGGDQFLMRLLCAQLFSLGVIEDSLLVWQAKQCNFDTFCAIDVQFLCGAGLDRTRSYLAGLDTDEARDALDYLAKCESKGDFADFTVGHVLKRVGEDYGAS